jgi:PAS domain S-box-containing protein
MQRNFRSVAESISEIFWIADMKKNVLIFVNGAYERIYGRDRNELYSASHSRFDAVHPDDHSRVRQAFRTLMKSGSCVVEYRIVRPDGAVRWLHEAAYTSRIDSECVTHCAGVAEDITLRRQYETQLRQAQKMEALGGLVGGMAHDFNNILSVIMASLDLIKRHFDQDKSGTELCDEALFSAERGAELIKNLLAFARRQSLLPKAIDANSLITMMRELLQRALGESITLRTTLAADLWLVSVDPIQLETALLNFATNARDAMPGGGTFDIGTRNRSLAAEDSHLLAELPPGDYVQIELRDTGVGIPSDSIAHIFEPFFTTKAPGVGTGLGLAMVYGFVRQSGGQLTVYSEPGRGTVFHVYLPRVADCQAHVLTQAIEEPVTGGLDIVLLVEDNMHLRRAVAAQLANLGYQVRQAEDARAALMILETDEPFDLLFTDIVMPGGIDGIALAERATALRPGLKILLTSGFPDVPNAASRIETSAFGILSKPYSRGDLARALRRALDQPAKTEG